MTRLLRKNVLLVVTFLLASLPLCATTKAGGPAAPNVLEVDGGQLAFGFNSALLNALAANGFAVAYHGSLAETAVGSVSNGRAFSVSGGLVDTMTGRGEFQTKGDIELYGINPLTRQAVDLELRHMTLDTTGNTPVVTAEVLLNGLCSGRIPIFTVVADASFTLPWKGSAYYSDVASLAVNVSFASFINTVAGAGKPMLSDGLSAGFLTMEAQINPALVA